MQCWGNAVKVYVIARAAEQGKSVRYVLYHYIFLGRCDRIKFSFGEGDYIILGSSKVKFFIKLLSRLYIYIKIKALYNIYGINRVIAD